MAYNGTDYSGGLSNIDQSTGIHFGVISAGKLNDKWYEESEPQYPVPCCPECGTELGLDLPEEYQFVDEEEPRELESDEAERWCASCETVMSQRDYEKVQEETEADVSVYEDEDYFATQQIGSFATDDDIFIVRSTYYTFAVFCSPCAPGACNLTVPITDPDELSPKAYCFGHEWFEDDIAPYPVYDVETNCQVLCYFR